MSGRLARASCWVMSARLGERLDALADVHEADVRGEPPAVALLRLGALALRLEGAAEPVENAQPLLVAARRQLQPAPQDGLRHRVRALLEEAHAQGLGGPQLALGRAQRFLELADRIVEQPHLLERDAQVVTRLEVRFVDVLVDPLPETRQHVLEVALPVPARLLVPDL